MAKRKSIQTNFLSGIIDPEAFGRVDSEVLANGAKDIENAYVTPVGNVLRREGLRFLKKIGDISSPSFTGGVRLVPVQYTESAGFSSPEKITGVLVFRLEVDVLGVPQDMFVSLVAFTESGADFFTTSEVSFGFLSTGDPLMQKAFEGFDTAGQGADTLVVQEDMPIATLRISGNPPTILNIIFQFETYVGATVPKIPVFAFSGVTEVSAGALDATLSATTGDSVLVTATGSFFTAFDEGASFIIAGDGGVLFVTEFISVTQVRGPVRVDFSSTTLVGAASGWVIERGFSRVWGGAVAQDWPRSVAIFQDRVWFGGSRRLPLTIWGSQVGDFDNFDFGKGEATAALEGIIASGEDSQIEDLYAGRDLIILTDASEYWSLGTSDSVLQPDSFRVKKASSIGSISGRVRADSVDGAVVQVDRSGEGVRDLVFLDKEDSYVSSLLNVGVSQLFSGKKILDFSSTIGGFGQVKHSLSFFLVGGAPSGSVFTNTELVVLNQLRDQNFLAWTRFTSPGDESPSSEAGVFQACASVASKSFFVCLRDGNFNVEVLDGAHRLDSSLLKDDGTLPASELLTTVAGEALQTVGGVLIFANLAASGPPILYTGFGHLSGRAIDVFCYQVAALADTPSLEREVQVTAGVFLLERGCLSVEGGLGYLTSVETLPLDVVTQFDQSFGEVKRLVNEKLYLLNSRNVIVEVGGVLFIPSFRPLDAAYFDTALPTFSGWKQYVVNSPVTRELIVKIKQDAPYDYNIRGMISEVVF